MSGLTIGVDIAKRFFQVHVIDGSDQVLTNRKLRRSEFLTFFEDLPPSLIGMESCGAAHHWARELIALGHEVKLMTQKYVKPYVKRGKNDAVDAEAICEAVTRPTMRFVAVKSVDQQSVLMITDPVLLIRQRTMLVNICAAISRTWHCRPCGDRAGRRVGRPCPRTRRRRARCPATCSIHRRDLRPTDHERHGRGQAA